MFPTGTAGAALLVLRVLAAATFIVDGSSHSVLLANYWMTAAFTIPAILLCVGLFTPLSSITCFLAQAAVLVMGESRDGLHLGSSMVVSAVVVALGPGAYSLDALLFGRRVFIIPPRR